MRAIKRATLAAATLTIDVRVYPATEQRETLLRQVHATDGGRVRYQRQCAIDGDNISYDDIGLGYEDEDGTLYRFHPDVEANLPTLDRIVVTGRAPHLIDPLRYGDPYLLGPDHAQDVAGYYQLARALRSGARRPPFIAVCTVRRRTTAATLTVRDGAILMHLLRRVDEMRRVDVPYLFGPVTGRAPADLTAALAALGENADLDPADQYEPALRKDLGL